MKALGLLLLIGALACGKGGDEARYAAAVRAARARSGAPSDQLVSVVKNGKEVTVTFFEQGEQHTLVGSYEAGFGRRYRIDGGTPYLQASTGEDQCEMTAPGTGEVRRAFRLDLPREIWIGESSNDGNAWRINEEGPALQKIVDGSSAEIGTVTYDGKNTVVTDAARNVAYSYATPKLEPAYGVLLFNRIPLVERYVVIAELMVRGR